MSEYFSFCIAWSKDHKMLSLLMLLSVIGAIIVYPIIYKTSKMVPAYSGEDRVSDGILPSDEQVNNAVVYDKVVIFGIDAGGAYFKEGVSPNFDRIFANGSKTFEGVSQFTTSSGENWGSMMTGVPAQVHNISNKMAISFPYNNRKYPTFFKVYKKRHKDAKFASAVNWGPINYGIIENFVGVTKYDGKSLAGTPERKAVDRKVANIIKHRVLKHNDKIVFMHFDNIDHVGHRHGYGSKEFIEAVKYADSLMGEIYDTCVKKGIEKTTLFICVTDHGHSLTGGHGGESITEKQITFAVSGGLGNIIKGTCGKFVTHDLPSVVLYALGEKQPESMMGRVPYNMFTTL